MPPRSKIQRLPPEVKAWLDTLLVESNFSNYEQIAAQLNRALEPYNMHVNKTSVHQYGKSFDEKLKSLRLISEQARAAIQASPDDEGAVSDALTRMVQEKMFGILMDVQVDPETGRPHQARACRCGAGQGIRHAEALAGRGPQAGAR